MTMQNSVMVVLVLVLVMFVHNVVGDAKCKVDQDKVVVKKDEYTRCNAATGYVISNPQGVVLSKFCSNADCQTYWNGMYSTGNLQCFQYSASAGNNVLKTYQGGVDCFSQYMGQSPSGEASTPVSTPASAPAPASVPAPAPAPPSPPTVTAAPTTSSSPSAGSPPSTPSAPSPSVGGIVGISSNTEPSGTQPPTHSTSSPPPKSSQGSDSGKVLDNQTGLGAEGSRGKGESGTGTNPINKIPTSTDTRNDSGVDEGGVGTVKSNNSTTTGSGAANTGNDPSKKRKSTHAGSGSNFSSRDGGDNGAGSDGGNDTPAGGSSSPYLITGGASAGVCIVGIVGFLYVRNRANHEVRRKNLDDTSEDTYLPTLQSSLSSSVHSFSMMENAVSGPVMIQSKSGFWEDEAIVAARIPFEKIKRGALMSRGGYGEVYRGTYRGEDVAIKTLLKERRKDLRQIEKFLAEVKLMVALEHEHIVQFVGVAWDSLNELCVVTEFMGRGDLRTLLVEYDEDPVRHPKGFNTDKIKIALAVSHALTFMHSLQPVVLHRDLKSRNILLDTKLNAKLTDFGISREHVDTTMTIGVGSSLWIAPEVMTGGYYDEKADVFSFGVVLSELDNHCLPYAHAVETGPDGRKLPDTVIVQMVTTGRIAVEFTNEITSPMAQLGRRCVALNPNDRPTTAEVQHQIHQLWQSWC